MGNADLQVQCPSAEVLLIGLGPMATVAVDAAAELDAAGVPTDVVTIEDGLAGGFGEAFCRAVRQAQVPVAVVDAGLVPAVLHPRGARRPPGRARPTERDGR